MEILITVASPPTLYTLSLHDALPIFGREPYATSVRASNDVWMTEVVAHLERSGAGDRAPRLAALVDARSEEHTSELESLAYLVCRLLLEKKKSPCGGLLPAPERILCT